MCADCTNLYLMFFFCLLSWCVHLESSVRDSFFTSIALSSHCFIYTYSIHESTSCTARKHTVEHYSYLVLHHWTILLAINEVFSCGWCVQGTESILHCNTLKHANCTSTPLLHARSKMEWHTWYVSQREKAWLSLRCTSSSHVGDCMIVWKTVSKHGSKYVLEVHCTGISLLFEMFTTVMQQEICGMNTTAASME